MKNTVLIVDDDLLYREMLSKIVANMGFSVETCEDGEKGIAWLNANAERALLVLLDLYMPQIDGLSALGHFRRHHPHVPVVVITGSDDPDDEKIALGLGVEGFIRKPLVSATIQQTIQDLLARAA